MIDRSSLFPEVSSATNIMSVSINITGETVAGERSKEYGVVALIGI